MTKTQYNVFVSGAALTMGVVTFHKSMQQQLIAFYPDRDPKLVKKAYNQMLRAGLTGKLRGVEINNDFLNAFFDIKYYALIEND